MRAGQRCQRRYPCGQARAAPEGPGMRAPPARHGLPRLLRNGTLGAPRAAAHLLPEGGARRHRGHHRCGRAGRYCREPALRGPANRRTDRETGRHALLQGTGQDHNWQERKDRPHPHPRLYPQRWLSRPCPGARGAEFREHRRRGDGLGAARPRGRGLPHWTEMGALCRPAQRVREISHMQCRRGRPGRLYGQERPGGQSAQHYRGNDRGRLCHGRNRGNNLYQD